MNHFERVAIFTVVEGIEKQLAGLKTLIAASAGYQASEHKTTSTIPTDTHELSDEDEEKLAKEIDAVRTAEVERMRKSAETHFQKEWDVAAKAMTNLDG